jgi:hypothetical protein
MQHGLKIMKHAFAGTAVDAELSKYEQNWTDIVTFQTNLQLG